MRHPPLLPLLLAVAACSCRGNAPPAAPPTEDAARIACDRFAARAIQTGDAREAALLSERAAACYTALEPGAP
jgi:hypothetical protein